MSEKPDPAAPDELPFVSTGALPTKDRVQRLVGDARARYRDDREGACSTVYPALARVPPDLFGVCVASVFDGVFVAGDVEHTIMSVAKPFVFALLCDRLWLITLFGIGVVVGSLFPWCRRHRP